MRRQNRYAFNAAQVARVHIMEFYNIQLTETRKFYFLSNESEKDSTHLTFKTV